MTTSSTIALTPADVAVLNALNDQALTAAVQLGQAVAFHRAEEAALIQRLQQAQAAHRAQVEVLAKKYATAEGHYVLRDGAFHKESETP